MDESFKLCMSNSPNKAHKWEEWYHMPWDHIHHKKCKEIDNFMPFYWNKGQNEKLAQNTDEAI